MSTNNLFNKLMANDTVSWTRASKFALVLIVLAASISALRTSYDKGYLTCANSEAYLSGMGILSRHGDYRLDVNHLHLQITVCLLICALGLWLRRPISLLLSLLALMWIGNIYLGWYLNTSAFMVEQEITDFSLLQGSGKQHLIALREGTWWDLAVLMLVIAASVWLVKRLILVFVPSQRAHR